MASFSRSADRQVHGPLASGVLVVLVLFGESRVRAGPWQGPGSCSTERASVSSAGTETAPGAGWCAISGEGRHVLFSSAGADLVPGDTNGVHDVFLRDSATGAVEIVSRGAHGIGDGVSFPGEASADGRFVAFWSTSTNLVPGGTTGVSHIFVRDRTTATTELVSVSTAGAQGNGYSIGPVISADGRYVAFESSSTNLVDADNLSQDVFVRDRSAGTTRLVSGGPYTAQNSTPAISADGRWVAYQRLHVSNPFEVLMRDLVTGGSVAVSVNALGSGGNDDSRFASVSADGRFIAFESRATNLAAGDTNGVSDVFVRDTLTASTELVSRASDGSLGNGGSFEPSISADGRFVAFHSEASNLETGDTNAAADVFVKDRWTGAIWRASRGSSGDEGAGSSIDASISSEGRRVVFTSTASNLVAGDTNLVTDVFARDCSNSAGVPLCQGTATTCPCGNGGAAHSGCRNSTAPGGAALVGSGHASIGADSVVLTVTGVPSTRVVVFFQATTALGGGSGIPSGDGLRCIGDGIVRLALRTANGGWAAFGAGVSSDPPVSVRGQLPPGGGPRYYQAWYGDAVGFCSPATTNFSNALLITWVP